MAEIIRFRWLIFLVTCIALVSAGRAGERSLSVVGYLPDYRVKEVTHQQLSGLTHLIYAGLTPTADGRFADPPIPDDVLARLHAIKKAHGCQLMISIGGWNRSTAFAALANEKSARKRFISGIAEYCRAHRFSGIDYDWEHPANADERKLYQQLIAETLDVFKPKNLQVTVAQAPWQDLGRTVYDHVDRVHLMSYDHEFPQATLAKSTSDVERLLEWGCPANKIALGVPFYGRNRQRETRTYLELLGNKDKDITQDEIGGYALNGRATISAKTRYAIQRELAGIMIWEITQDSADEGDSLLHAILQTVRKQRKAR